MGNNVLVVRSADLEQRVEVRRFKALPEEEIQRLHASVEVLCLDAEQVEQDCSYRQLVSFTAVHRNYAWLTFSQDRFRGGGPAAGDRSLGFRGNFTASAATRLFLDDDFKADVSTQLAATLSTSGGYDLRLAGLIDDRAQGVGGARLGFVYVARLRQPGIESRDRAITDVQLHGNSDLRRDRNLFDPWSRIVIDHLQAL